MMFWNVRCSRCPLALAKMRALAPPRFLACALAVSVDNNEEFEVAREYATTHGFVKHFGFMNFQEKEAAKRALGFARLPFCVVVVDGTVVASGDPLDAESGIEAAVRAIL